MQSDNPIDTGTVVDDIGAELDDAAARGDWNYASELAAVMLSLHRACQKRSIAIKCHSKLDKTAYETESDTFLFEASDRWTLLRESSEKGERDIAT